MNSHQVKREVILHIYRNNVSKFFLGHLVANLIDMMEHYLGQISTHHAKQVF